MLLSQSRSTALASSIARCKLRQARMLLKIAPGPIFHLHSLRIAPMHHGAVKGTRIGYINSFSSSYPRNTHDYNTLFTSPRIHWCRSYMAHPILIHHQIGAGPSPTRNAEMHVLGVVIYIKKWHISSKDEIERVLALRVVPQSTDFIEQSKQ